jgi:hypothetical protein
MGTMISIPSTISPFRSPQARPVSTFDSLKTEKLGEMYF